MYMLHKLNGYNTELYALPHINTCISHHSEV